MYTIDNASFCVEIVSKVNVVACYCLVTLFLSYASIASAEGFYLFFVCWNCKQSEYNVFLLFVHPLLLLFGVPVFAG